MLVLTLPPLACTTLLGCAGSSPRSSDTQGLSRSEAYLQSNPAPAPAGSAAPGRPTSTDSIAFLTAADPIAWSQLRPLLAETAAPIIEELATDQVLRAQCAQAGISITAADTAAEEKRLMERLMSASAADAAAGSELLERLRSARALGPRRYQALLERNAMLRKLVASDVTVTPEQLEQARAVRYGPRYKGRVLITRTEREAAQARTQIAAAPDPRVQLAALASASSVTSTLYPAGLVDPISAADPTYPSALRSVIQRLQPGELSPVIALDKTFAIFMLEEVLPGTPAPASAAASDAELERNVRAANERVAMERRAQQALSVAGVNVLDADLRWSWEHRAK